MTRDQVKSCGGQVKSSSEEVKSCGGQVKSNCEEVKTCTAEIPGSTGEVKTCTGQVKCSTALVLNGAYAVRGGVRRVTEVVISAMTHREPAEPAAGVASAAVSKPKGAAPAGKRPPSPEGSKGNPDHQATVGELEKLAKREFPDRERYEIRSNKSIEKESGLKRRPDQAVIDRFKKKVVKVYEAARANKDGVTPVSRERKKVQEYDGKGIPSHVEIVR